MKSKGPFELELQILIAEKLPSYSDKTAIPECHQNEEKLPSHCRKNCNWQGLIFQL